MLKYIRINVYIDLVVAECIFFSVAVVQNGRKRVIHMYILIWLLLNVFFFLLLQLYKTVEKMCGNGSFKSNSPSTSSTNGHLAILPAPEKTSLNSGDPTLPNVNADKQPTSDKPTDSLLEKPSDNVNQSTKTTSDNPLEDTMLEKKFNNGADQSSKSVKRPESFGQDGYQAKKERLSEELEDSTESLSTNSILSAITNLNANPITKTELVDNALLDDEKDEDGIMDVDEDTSVPGQSVLEGFSGVKSSATLPNPTTGFTYPIDNSADNFSTPPRALKNPAGGMNPTGFTYPTANSTGSFSSPPSALNNPTGGLTNPTGFTYPIANSTGSFTSPTGSLSNRTSGGLMSGPSAALAQLAFSQLAAASNDMQQTLQQHLKNMQQAPNNFQQVMMAAQQQAFNLPPYSSPPLSPLMSAGVSHNMNSFKNLPPFLQSLRNSFAGGDNYKSSLASDNLKSTFNADSLKSNLMAENLKNIMDNNNVGEKSMLSSIKSEIIQNSSCDGSSTPPPPQQNTNEMSQENGTGSPRLEAPEGEPGTNSTEPQTDAVRYIINKFKYQIYLNIK